MSDHCPLQQLAKRLNPSALQQVSISAKIGEVRQSIEGLRRWDLFQAGRLESWLAELRQAYDGRILPVDIDVAEEWGG